MQRTADLLHAKGIVTYADNPAHRRAKLVTLTRRGRSVLNWISKRAGRWANALGGRLGESDVRRGLKVVQAFRQALEQGTEESSQ